MLNIVLFGAPGCGKGTQASRLREHYGINHVSTGEVIRAEIARGTELGRSMEEYIKSGRLAPDAVVIGMIANYVAEHRDAAAGIAHRAEHAERSLHRVRACVVAVQYHGDIAALFDPLAHSGSHPAPVGGFGRLSGLSAGHVSVPP